MSHPLSRRLAVRLGAGAAGLMLVGCEDSPPRGGPSPGASSRGGTTAPTRDPAELAALRVAAGDLQTLVARYDAVSRKHTALRTRLAAPRKLHTVQLARLRDLGGVPAAIKPNTRPVPAAAAALSELAASEQRLAVTHATAAAQRSGQAARLLAMIAASQSQVAVALRRKGG